MVENRHISELSAGDQSMRPIFLNQLRRIEGRMRIEDFIGKFHPYSHFLFYKPRHGHHLRSCFARLKFNQVNRLINRIGGLVK